METKKQSEPEVLRYILTAFPPELEILKQIAAGLRQRNRVLASSPPSDVEPVLVTCLWMRRVLKHAQAGKLDVKGVFELSACLSRKTPKVLTQKQEKK